VASTCHLALQGLSIVDLPNIARQVNKEVAWDIQYAPEETHTRVGHVRDFARVISLSGSPPADGKPVIVFMAWFLQALSLSLFCGQVFVNDSRALLNANKMATCHLRSGQHSRSDEK
jgi:hypothetical protein